jgi:hypothetical protein
VDSSAGVGGIEGGGIIGVGLQVVEELLDDFEGGFDAGVEEGDGDFGAEEVDVGLRGDLAGQCFDRRVGGAGISSVADDSGHFG